MPDLTLLDNPALQIPLVLPFSLGRRLEIDAFGLPSSVEKDGWNWNNDIGSLWAIANIFPLLFFFLYDYTEKSPF